MKTPIIATLLLALTTSAHAAPKGEFSTCGFAMCMTAVKGGRRTRILSIGKPLPPESNALPRAVVLSSLPALYKLAADMNNTIGRISPRCVMLAPR